MKITSQALYALGRFFFLMGCGVTASARVDAAMLEFSPAASVVAPGTTFFTDVVLRDTVDLFNFQLSVGVNPSVLSIAEVTEGAFLLTGGSTFFVPGSFDAASGVQSFVFDTLIGALSGVSGSGVVATLRIDAIAGGTSSLVFSDVLLLDSSLATIPTT